MYEKDAPKAFKWRTIGIIVTGFISMFLSCCLAVDMLNIIQPAFSEKFGFSLTSITLPITVGGYIVIFIAYLFSTIVMKKGTRGFVTISFIVLIVATMLIAIGYNMPSGIAFVMLAAGELLSKIFVQAIQIVVMQVCANWFIKSRGRIISIIMMARAIDNAFATTLATKGEEFFGFTAVYVFLTVVLIIACLLGVVFFINRPEEVGLHADGLAEAPAQAVSEEENYVSPWTLKKVLTTKEAWFIMLSIGIFSFSLSAIMTEYVMRVNEVGVNLNFALACLSIAGVAGIPISYVYGWITDKFGANKAGAFMGCGFVAISVAMFFLAEGRGWLLVVAAIGIAMFTGVPICEPNMIITTFGAKNYQAVYRYMKVVMNLISAGAVTFMTLIHDVSGSFDLAFLLLAILCAFGTVCCALCNKSYADEA